MIFSNIDFNDEEPIYIQIKNNIKDMISKGMLNKGSKLPSTRELSEILNVSRNSVISAFEELKDEGVIHSQKGKGTFVSISNVYKENTWNINWDEKYNKYANLCEELDIVKSEIPWEKDLISFKSISPQGELFDIDEIKKSFLNRISLEGHKLLNYGYAKGYQPLINYLLSYMEDKGVDTSNKDILITNGFTEGLDIILSSFTKSGDTIICENPTHNTAIKLFKVYDLNIVGIDMTDNGMDLEILEKELKNNDVKLSFVVPSYHNPTGIVMRHKERYELYNLMKKYNVPIIEDGFNEELLHTGSHICPIAALDGSSNGVLYVGSFSKVLFPGMRIGWILADKSIISKLESVKRCKNIHVSFLDQAILYDYLNNGSFEKYMKKIKKFYKEKYEFALECVKKYIHTDYIMGEGGLHIFLKLDNINSRELLTRCYEKGVIFMCGDVFYTDDSGHDTLRLGFSRLDFEDIEKGIKIIGSVIDELR